MGLTCFLIDFKQYRILVQIAMKGPDLLPKKSRFYLKVLFFPYYTISQHKVPMAKFCNASTEEGYIKTFSFTDGPSEGQREARLAKSKVRSCSSSRTGALLFTVHTYGSLVMAFLKS